MRQTACARRSLAGMIGGGGTLEGSPMFSVRRREFVALFGGAGLLLAAKVRRARAQQPERGGKSAPRALGLTVPDKLLARAGEVIE